MAAQLYTYPLSSIRRYDVVCANFARAGLATVKRSAAIDIESGRHSSQSNITPVCAIHSALSFSSPSTVSPRFPIALFPSLSSCCCPAPTAARFPDLYRFNFANRSPCARPERSSGATGRGKSGNTGTPAPHDQAERNHRPQTLHLGCRPLQTRIGVLSTCPLCPLLASPYARHDERRGDIRVIRQPVLPPVLRGKRSKPAADEGQGCCCIQPTARRLLRTESGCWNVSREPWAFGASAVFSKRLGQSQPALELVVRVARTDPPRPPRARVYPGEFAIFFSLAELVFWPSFPAACELAVPLLNLSIPGHSCLPPPRRLRAP